MENKPRVGCDYCGLDVPVRGYKGAGRVRDKWEALYLCGECEDTYKAEVGEMRKEKQHNAIV